VARGDDNGSEGEMMETFKYLMGTQIGCKKNINRNVARHKFFVRTKRYLFVEKVKKIIWEDEKWNYNTYT